MTAQSEYYSFKRLRVDEDNQIFIDKDGTPAYHRASVFVYDIQGFQDGVYKTGILITSDERIPTVETGLVHERRVQELKDKLKEAEKLIGKTGSEVAKALKLSEPTIARRRKSLISDLSLALN